jgi:hypothetical protein
MMPFRPTFTFENKDFDSNGRKFGVLNITTENNNETQANMKPIHIRFNNDNSSSMDERTDNKRHSRSKIYYLKQSMIGILKHLASISDTTNITITIYNFNSDITELINNVKVTKDNLGALIEKVLQVHPSGCTNFENIMKNSFDELTSRIGNNPDHIYADVLMTDGDITEGEGKIETLKKFINSNIINAFIGYGYDQNSVLLNSFSKVVNGSYSCIDNVEKGALVYGEVLSNIINIAFTKVTITIQNGLIYDWKENKFVDILAVDNFIWGSVKSFHIISENPEQVVISIIALSSRTGEAIQIIVSEKNEEDLTNFKYRHKVLDLLHRINCFNEEEHLYNKSGFSYYCFGNNLSDDCLLEKEKIHLFNKKYKETKKSFKKELCDLFNEIKLYMTTNLLSEDNFYKRLLDDLYITHLTLGTKYGNMYTCARQTSQGEQRVYSATDTPRAPKDDEDNFVSCFNAPSRTRCVNGGGFSRSASVPEEDYNIEYDDDEPSSPRKQIHSRQTYSLSDDIDLGSDDDEDMDCHNVTDDCELTPYSNFNTTTTMRSVSNRNYDEEEENAEDDSIV